MNPLFISLDTDQVIGLILTFAPALREWRQDLVITIRVDSAIPLQAGIEIGIQRANGTGWAAYIETADRESNIYKATIRLKEPSPVEQNVIASYLYERHSVSWIAPQTLLNIYSHADDAAPVYLDRLLGGNRAYSFDHLRQEFVQLHVHDGRIKQDPLTTDYILGNTPVILDQTPEALA